MQNVTVTARITPELKQQAEAVFTAIGLSTSDAIRLFLQQSVNSGGLPFQPVAKRPSANTLAAMAELDSGGGQVFEAAEELFEDWRKP